MGDGFGIRFSKASGTSFSNTILSLAALRTLDDKPLIVCIVRPNRLDFMLANATFVKKISHSSMQLSVSKVRGSFNGGDVIKEYGGLANQPENFEQLFAMHAAFRWEENLERIVEATSGIVSRGERFQPTEVEREVILLAPERTSEAPSACSRRGPTARPA